MLQTSIRIKNEAGEHNNILISRNDGQSYESMIQIVQKIFNIPLIPEDIVWGVSMPWSLP